MTAIGVSLVAALLSADPAQALDGPADGGATAAPVAQFQMVVTGEKSTLRPIDGSDGTSTAAVTRESIQNIPGGETRQLNDLVATEPGISRDSYGAIHVRGNFAGLGMVVDGIPLPPSVQDRLQQLLSSQIVDETDVIVGGLPAEFGEQVGGVLDVHTRHPAGNQGEAELSYGTYNELVGEANAGGQVGPLGYLAAASLESTDRGLEAPAASPILHDQLRDGRGFLRLDEPVGSRDRMELLAAYGESHYQIPMDPSVLPLSDGPPGAVRGTDAYGNTAPDFVPYDADPTELERDLFSSVSWFHDFGREAQLQVAPYFRYEDSLLGCDIAGQLGATADPGQSCSDVDHAVLQGGAVVNQTLDVGIHHFKAGLLVDGQHSAVDYTEFTRLDSSPVGGADPSQTLSGSDVIDSVVAGVYAQDRMVLGKWALFPGLRLDYQRAGLAGTDQGSSLWGPSLRLGASYAISELLTFHVYVGDLWQPPSYDAPAAARVLGLIPPEQPVPFDLQAELDYYAETGLAARSSWWAASVVAWGRLSQHTLDDNDVGDSALTADFNYQRGRALGAEVAGSLSLARHLKAFANATAEVAEGEGIASAQYLFTPQQLAFTGYQAVDNAQLLTVNAGVDVSDDSRATHASLLVSYGSGLRTGPTNNATLPPSTVFDISLRHRFDAPLHPTLALDVKNLFDEVYAYRISTGSLAGSAYGPLREIDVRLVVPWGGSR